jgi:enoyl-CoA hydratase
LIGSVPSTTARERNVRPPESCEQRIVPAASLLDEAIKLAERIAGQSLPIAMLVKESVNRAFETTLAEGIRFERRLFHATFATADQKEGMAAFVEKRKPAFKNR